MVRTRPSCRGRRTQPAGGSHNWYGFGAVDVDAAVTFARSYTANAMGALVVGDWIASGAALGLPIPDDSSAGASSTLHVTGDLTIESIQIEVTITRRVPRGPGARAREPVRNAEHPAQHPQRLRSGQRSPDGGRVEPLLRRAGFGRLDGEGGGRVRRRHGHARPVENPHLRSLRENDMAPRIRAVVALAALIVMPLPAEAQARKSTLEARRAQALASAPMGPPSGAPGRTTGSSRPFARSG